MTVEKIKEVRFMKCATMLRKQYGNKISHVYCEVDDTKDGSIIFVQKFSSTNTYLKFKNYPFEMKNGPFEIRKVQFFDKKTQSENLL